MFLSTLQVDYALMNPGIDLGVLMAICSSHRDIPIDRKTVMVGEVGLGVKFDL